jgi:hypothetical protein
MSALYETVDDEILLLPKAVARVMLRFMILEMTAVQSIVSLLQFVRFLTWLTRGREKNLPAIVTQCSANSSFCTLLAQSSSRFKEKIWWTGHTSSDTTNQK